MSNLIIGIGNAGKNCVKLAASSNKLDDTKFYAIDSMIEEMDSNINFISTMSDEKTGSGRDRERGKAMYEFHETHGDFNKMYEDAKDAKSPVIVITSAAGGTGSGSAVPLCKGLLKAGCEQVIPIIICPNKLDPAAFHLNTTELFQELGKVGIATYAIFENKKGDADYLPINTEVVEMIELIFGKRYDKTNLDSIDDSDLDKLLEMPGRIIALTVSANSINNLQKEITRRLFVGSQPMWNPDEVKKGTLMMAYSLKSMFADVDFKNVFNEIDARIDPEQVFDQYRNIVKNDNNGISEASIIITGLPRSEVKIISDNYKEVDGIDAGLNEVKRPSFLNRKKPIRKFKGAVDTSMGVEQFEYKNKTDVDTEKNN